MNYLKIIDSPLGSLALSSDGTVLTGLWFDGQKNERLTLKGKPCQEADLPIFKEVEKWLEIYFTGKDPGFTPPLKIEGSDFRIMVAQIMLSIPFGTTMTYGQIAEEVAGLTGKKKMSAQAVGGAVGHNPIGIIIPCHRVLGSDGSLTGYAGGLDKKIYLLRNEGVILKQENE